MSKILLLDGNSLTYRAFFALPTDMATASGQVTNAVFGFTSMLINLLRDHKPDGVGRRGFDRPEPTFRHEQVADYKANRTAAPDILRQQMGLVRQVVEALAHPAPRAAGFEADDIIATLATQARDRGDDVIVVTGDRDSYQLVEDPHIKVLYNRRGVSDYVLYDEAGIKERTGVDAGAVRRSTPRCAGDPSDNLPGVPGVGEKTAAKLINTYGGLDGIFANVDEQTPEAAARTWSSTRPRPAPERRGDGAAARRRPIDIDLDDFGRGQAVDTDEVRRLFDFLEFRTLFDRLAEALDADLGDAAIVERSGGGGRGGRVAGRRPPSRRRVLSGAGPLDLGRGLDRHSRAARRSTGLAVGHRRRPAAEVAWLPAAPVRRRRRSPLATFAVGRPLRAHNAKPLLRAAGGARHRGAHAEPRHRARRVPARPGRDALRDRRRARAATPATPWPDGGRRKASSTSAATDDPRHRAGRSRRRWPSAGWRRPSKAPSKRRACASCTTTSRTRWCACWPAWRPRRRRRRRRRAAQAASTSLADECDRLSRRDPGGGGTVQHQLHAAAAPGAVRRARPFAAEEDQDRLLHRRRVAREAGRSAWPEFIDPLLSLPRGREAALDLRRGPARRGRPRRSHPRHVQPDRGPHRAGCPPTNRTCTTSPCAPRRVASSARRSCPPRAHELLVADYNQIELRCIAHLAEDPGLIEAFTSGEDIHNATAARIFGVDPKVTHRATVEGEDGVVRPGLRHGGLRPRPAAQHPHRGSAEILDAYFVAFPEREGVHGAHGRRGPRARLHRDAVRAPPADPRAVVAANFRIRQAGERQAMNAGIQGLAADIFKVALMRPRPRPAGRIRQPAHPAGARRGAARGAAPEEKDAVATLTLDSMRNAAHLNVPLEVNLAFGPSWADAKIFSFLFAVLRGRSGGRGKPSLGGDGDCSGRGAGLG